MPVARKKHTVAIRETVLSNTEKVVDSLALDGFCGAKYLICIKNTIEDVHKICELLASRIKNDDVSDSICSKLGDSFGTTIKVQVIGSDVQLIVGNLEAYDFEVSILRTSF